VDDSRKPLAYNPYVYDVYLYDYDWYDYQPLPTFKSDSQIKTDIKSELFWNPFVNQQDVRVQVDEGVATLKGKVDTWGEWNTALEEAYEGGATWVYNKLTVK
jgi:osmotically-inducible protein OsmY